MILYRNTKMKVRSPDGTTEYFDIVAGLLRGNTSIDKIKENGFELKEAEGTPQKTITDADYADDIAILANAPAQVKTLPHGLERATAGIDLCVNAHKTDYLQ